MSPDQNHTRVIAFESLPNDMQDILMSFFGEYGQLAPSQLNIKAVSVFAFPDVPLADGVSDERGPQYAREMIGEVVPPVVVCGHHWLDGRHRVWAQRHSRMKTVDVIDIGDYLSSEAIGVIEPIGTLDPAVLNVCARWDAVPVGLHDRWSVYQEKSAQLDDGFVRWVEDDSSIYVTDIQAGQKARGAAILLWLKIQSAKTLHAIGVVDDAIGFWDLMEERGLIDGQSEQPWMEYFGLIPAQSERQRQ